MAGQDDWHKNLFAVAVFDTKVFEWSRKQQSQLFAEVDSVVVVVVVVVVVAVVVAVVGGVGCSRTCRSDWCSG